MNRILFLWVLIPILLVGLTHSAFGELSNMEVQELQEHLQEADFNSGSSDSGLSLQAQIENLPSNTPAGSPVTEKPLQIQASALKDTLKAFNTSEWTRLIILGILIIGGFGLLNCLILGGTGTALAFLLHHFAGWPWALSLQAGLAMLFTLPIFLSMAWKSFGALILFALVLGLPTFLISRFVFGSTWVIAAADGFVLMTLMPRAVILTLERVGILNREFLDAVRQHPELFETIKATNPRVIEIIKNDPSVFQLICQYVEARSWLEKEGEDLSSLPKLLELLEDLERDRESFDRHIMAAECLVAFHRHKELVFHGGAPAAGAASSPISTGTKESRFDPFGRRR